MKKTFTVSLILLFVNALMAQLPYVLDTRDETFQYLANPSVLTGSSATVSLPYAFEMSGPSLTTATVNTSADGYMNFGSEGIVSLVGGMGYLNNRTQCGYEVSGTSPNRILKMEWRAQSFTATPAADDSVTYQIWLYETTNIIEWHFGPNAWYNGSFGNLPPLVIIIYGGSYYSISGAVNNPVFLNCGFSCHLQGLPVSGKVYRLIPSAIVGIDERTDNKPPNVFPNPSKGQVMLDFGNKKRKSVLITDLKGNIVYEDETNEVSKEFYLHATPGIYLLIVSYDSGSYRKKLVVLKE